MLNDNDREELLARSIAAANALGLVLTPQQMQQLQHTTTPGAREHTGRRRRAGKKPERA